MHYQTNSNSHKDCFASILKFQLTQAIRKMAAAPGSFVKDKDRQFTRNRKLPFAKLLYLILFMRGGSIPHILKQFFSYSTDMPSASAFLQQRGKLAPSAMSHLFHSFTQSLSGLSCYKGYRLLAVDGASHTSVFNPNDKETFCKKSKDRKGFNCTHLNALYDLENNIYVEAVIQGRKERDEPKALIDMVKHSRIQKAILIADRGYESYNNFAHLIEKGWGFVVRVKDPSSNGFLKTVSLPDQDTFDVEIIRIITRSKAKEIRKNPKLYRKISSTTKFDFINKENPFYEMRFRVVRIKTKENSYVTMITNLPQEKFPSKEINLLYQKRWGIETSFRKLKYAIGTSVLHSKKYEYIQQEIFAKLIMYNFSERITGQVVIEQGKRKYTYIVNFTEAADSCHVFFFGQVHLTAPDLETLIKRFIVPVRPNRNYKRKLVPKSAQSFTYRIAS